MDNPERIRSARKGKIDPRIPLTNFSPTPTTPGSVWAILLISALTLIAVLANYVLSVPPAHLLIIAAVILWDVWNWRKG